MKGGGLGKPTPTLVPCWSLNPCLQGTSVGVGLPQLKGGWGWESIPWSFSSHSIFSSMKNSDEALSLMFLE